MGSVVVLEQWRARRDHPSIASRRSAAAGAGAGDRAEGAGGFGEDRVAAGEVPDLDALERAVADLLAAMGRLDPQSPADPELETELLALVGELAMGWVDRARRRAERAATWLSTDLPRGGG